MEEQRGTGRLSRLGTADDSNDQDHLPLWELGTGSNDRAMERYGAPVAGIARLRGGHMRAGGRVGRSIPPPRFVSCASCVTQPSTADMRGCCDL